VAAETTPSQTVGPYFSLGLLLADADQVVPPEAPGAIRLTGCVRDGDGEPVPDAMVEVWQADEEGRYRPEFGWARSGCEPDGRYSLVVVKPGRVSDADGGLQAPHLTMLVFARGLLKPVLTRMYFPDEADANAEDHVLSALDGASSLVARSTGDGLEFDINLQGEDETVFFAL
jgi:protocatechuate 3,4-dioxygenase, alpha subunit